MQRVRQQGVALITAIMVVALVTVAAVAMTTRQQVDIRRTGNILDVGQAFAYAFGVEGWVREVLRRDAEDNQTDHLGEVWAQQVVFPAARGQLSGQLVDLRGRFNLNGLWQNGTVDNFELERFQRLLQVLALSPDIAGAVLDWIDDDANPRFPGGAEDGVYLGKERPYRTANRPLLALSELKKINGIDAEAYEALAPHVTALPSPAGININTATKEVLMALANGITDANAEMIISDREDDPFEKVDDFLQHQALAGISIDSSGLAVASDYFMIEAAVVMEKVNYTFNTLVYRPQSGQTVMIARSRGEF